MRKSREAMAQHHRNIVEGGARLLRERGIEGLSVADLMQAAGLTHGGFYRHFASKDAFVCEATDAAFAGVAAMRGAAAPDQGPDAQLLAFLGYYLSQAHCDDPGMGCPIAAFGGEAARASAEIRERFAVGVEGVLDWISARLGGTAEQRRSGAAEMLAVMVGAVVAARAVGAGDLADGLLGAARRHGAEIARAGANLPH
ncbi:MAG: helix-turn-helix domain-containing protein [Novosphingobium sp.]|uniref:TetR/AcrR family transcriptional regulator n=1 Tax=Novosphingobium sp. TaxID=1874826 RepID=UPI0032B7D9DE